ncbi:MAG: hypothetical protein FK734_00405 [Asgard group archaeon]|nr:hypothetical protein [Asgard group archaeon]
MKKLGKVSIISKKGNILIKSTTGQRLGSRIVNQQLKYVGKIVDIIGPTSTPYIVVNTRDAEAQTKENELLYLVDAPKTKSSTQRKRTRN